MPSRRTREGPESGDDILEIALKNPNVAEAIRTYEEAMIHLRSAGALRAARRRVTFTTTYSTVP